MKKRSHYLLVYQPLVIYMLNNNGSHVKHSIVEEKISSLTTYIAVSNKRQGSIKDYRQTEALC